MKAYWIVRCHVNDLNEFSKYAKLAGPIIHKHNGNFLARGGEQKELEGDGYERTVLVEFNSSEQAYKCYNSKEYQEALVFVKNSAERLVVIVEGTS